MIGYRMSRGPDLKEMARKRERREMLAAQEPRKPEYGVLHTDAETGDQYWSDYGWNVILRKRAGDRVWVSGPWADAADYDVPDSAVKTDVSFPIPHFRSA